MFDQSSPISVKFDDALKEKVVFLRTLTGSMTEMNVDTISAEQDKIREHFGTKKKPDCFAIGICLIENLTNKTKWSDFTNLEQYRNFSENTNRVRNTYENQHDVSGNRLRCICGQDIGRDTSYFYSNMSFSPVYLLIGQSCLLKHKLVNMEQLRKLRKEKKEYLQKKRLEKEAREIRLKYPPTVWCAMCNEKCLLMNPYGICKECFVIFQNSN
jgi:hypothetical protein